MSRTKNRRQAKSEPAIRVKKQTTRRRAKSVSKRHKIKNIYEIRSKITDIETLTKSINSYLDTIDEIDDINAVKRKIIKSAIAENRNIDLDIIKEGLYHLNDLLIEKIEEIRGHEGLVDNKDFGKFNPELHANDY